MGSIFIEKKIFLDLLWHILCIFMHALLFLSYDYFKGIKFGLAAEFNFFRAPPGTNGVPITGPITYLGAKLSDAGVMRKWFRRLQIEKWLIHMKGPTSNVYS